MFTTCKYLTLFLFNTNVLVDEEDKTEVPQTKNEGRLAKLPKMNEKPVSTKFKSLENKFHAL